MTDEVPHADASRKRILQGIAAAFLVAAVVLVVAVLPAEYGLDPTGAGAAFGFTRLASAPEVDAPGVVEEVERPLALFRAEWILEATPILEHDGHTEELGQDRVEFPLNVTNLTKVTARLTWDDEDGVPDEFEVSLRAPDGRRSQLVTTTTGNATAELAWRSVPFPAFANGTATFPAPAPEDVEGTWTAIVRLYDASEATAPEGKAWTLKVTAESFRLDLVQEADVPARDTARVTLGPGQDIEYKFLLQEGATMEYHWTSTAPVHADFHADTEADPDDFTSFGTVGPSTGATGTHVAPFTGRHGWYWRNDLTSPVTITLSTRGTYAILGVIP